MLISGITGAHQPGQKTQASDHSCIQLMPAMQSTTRPDLSRVTSADVAPLEALFTPHWPEVWRELACSVYITLVSNKGLLAGMAITPAELAVQAVQGIAKDLGGTQPYIPRHMSNKRSNATKVIALLAQGNNYKQAAAACGITESRVRKIEHEHRKNRAAAQAKSV